MDSWQFKILKRIVVAICMVGLWVVSSAFSINGFGFIVEGWMWAGLVFTASVTAGEFMMTAGASKKSVKLLLFGLACYAYDVGTTFVGMLFAQGTPSFYDKPWLYAMDAVIATFLAFVPEVGFEWAVTEESDSNGGFDGWPRDPNGLPKVRVKENSDTPKWIAGLTRGPYLKRK